MKRFFADLFRISAVYVCSSNGKILCSTFYRRNARQYKQHYEKKTGEFCHIEKTPIL